MFTKDDIYVFIFGWKKVMENTKNLYENISDCFPNTTIINCNEHESFLANEIQLDDSYYYGGQFETALRNLPEGKILGIITGDVYPSANWEAIANRCIKELNTGKIGIYAPDVNTHHNSRNKLLWDDMWEVENTDCTCWFLDPSIIKPWKHMPYHRVCNLGWGIDKILIQETINQQKYVARDYGVRVEQPPGTGYNQVEALVQMNNLVRQFKDLNWKKVVFSFSLWGSQEKYTNGMIQNAKQISIKFPKAFTYIYITEDVPIDIKDSLIAIPNVCLIPCSKKEGILNMFDRFLAIDECDIMFVRDADSRIHDRDRGCIYDFLASRKTLHIIRDHYYHKNRIMGGMWGYRKNKDMPSMKLLIEKWISDHKSNSYGSDQIFLGNTIYNIHKESRLIHDRYSIFAEEEIDRVSFPVPIKDNLFVGQVFIYKDGKETTEFNA